MAQSGFTPISLYNSSTPSAVPTAGNLVSGELALNIADGKLYFKNSSNIVTLLADAAASGITLPLSVSNGGTGLTTLATGRIPYGNGTSAFSSSSSLDFDGTTLILGPGSTLGGATNPFLAVTGNTDAYIQAYVFNANSGTSASADIAVYPDNGLDTSGWIDVGITSSAYSDAAFPITIANEGYILMSAPAGASKTGNLVYATDSTGTTNSHQWYVGGFTLAKSAWSMQLTSTGLQLATPLAASSGGTGASSLPAGGLVGVSATQTLTNKRITPRIGTTTSAATITPTADASDQYNVTALATTATFAIPSGTPTNGQKLSIRITDSGSGQTISWTTSAGGYRVIGTTLPTSIAAGKTIYVGCVYNTEAGYWDVVAVATQA
jgi:hypothetical protein